VLSAYLRIALWANYLLETTSTSLGFSIAAIILAAIIIFSQVFAMLR
jgi:hypothetical protein